MNKQTLLILLAIYLAVMQAWLGHRYTQHKIQEAIELQAKGNP